jgi:hypothetical protein
VADVAVQLAAFKTSGLGTMGLLGDSYAWFVPAFVSGVPGVLLIVIVLLQLVGGGVWAPAVRRLRGDPSRRQPHRTRARQSR